MPPARSPSRAGRSSRPPAPRTAARLGLILVTALAAGTSTTAAYYYVSFSRLIETRLGAGTGRVQRPRVFARPLELRRGQATTVEELVERLNDLGYAHRAVADRPGEFAIGRAAVAVIPRDGELEGRRVRLVVAGEPGRLTAIDAVGLGAQSALTLEAPLLTALVSTGREKRRYVPLAAVPPRLVEAVLAIEDRRFYEHPGVDPIRMIGALLTNLRGDRPYLVGGSTLTQQLVKNLFLTPEKTLRRKLLEQLMAVVLERRLSKDQILELYLNEVYLGHVGSFAVHGVAEGARVFFAKDVSNLTLAEAATIAGIIQSPQAHSPFRHPERARERRDLVLRQMADAGFLLPDTAAATARDPLRTASRGIESDAPYFADFVNQVLAESHPDLDAAAAPVDIYTTLDLALQRIAQDEVRHGLDRVDGLLARRPGKRRAQAALVAVDPRTGEIRALVGGRSYADTQFNRATSARRQPGSVFKPFVYLTAFEQDAAAGQPALTPATIVVDEPAAFDHGRRVWQPANYGHEYDGPITLRRALAFSRNVATIKVAERIGYDRVAALWQRVGAGAAPQPYPSIALGVFEATPLEVAEAYTVFPNLGRLQPLQAIARIRRAGRDLPMPPAQPRRIAAPDTTFLVTHMMRSVLDEGTGSAARAEGFTHDAAGKSGTTNDLRDAWFVGFTPELLAVVWVGVDDNRPLGLSGAQAALPIWTAFMRRALAGRPSRAFDVPLGVTFVRIDRDTGLVALPGCPRSLNEAFLAGTEPWRVCELHRY